MSRALTDVTDEPVPSAGEPGCNEKSRPMRTLMDALLGTKPTLVTNLGFTISGARTVVLPVVRNCVFSSQVIGKGIGVPGGFGEGIVVGMSTMPPKTIDLLTLLGSRAYGPPALWSLMQL